MIYEEQLMKEEQFLREILSTKGYELCKMAGEGATAQVYKVKEKESGQWFACKIGEKKELLFAESELLRNLNHPLFPEWKEYWEEAGAGFLFMEFIQGRSLNMCLETYGKFPQKEVLRITLALADGLGYLHERKPAVIYCDLKPENIILQSDGRVRLTDLGAAAVPKGWKVGTPGYAAPEQMLTDEKREERSKPVPASDIYALGVVMHQMLTGQYPCADNGEMLPVRKYDPKISLGVEDIIWHCTRPCPRERIQGMRELMTKLGGYYNRSKLQIMRLEWKTVRKRKSRLVYEKNVWDNSGSL